MYRILGFTYKTKFPKVFSGLGCFTKPYCIKLDEATQPTVVPPRNLPAAIRDRVKTTLDEMERMNVMGQCLSRNRKTKNQETQNMP